MTRKKWNTLRRRRPELFSMLPAWEKLSPYELDLIRPVSKARAITVMTTWFLRGYQGYISDLIREHPPEKTAAPPPPAPDYPLPF